MSRNLQEINEMGEEAQSLIEDWVIDLVMRLHIAARDVGIQDVRLWGAHLVLDTIEGIQRQRSAAERIFAQLLTVPQLVAEQFLLALLLLTLYQAFNRLVKGIRWWLGTSLVTILALTIVSARGEISLAIGAALLGLLQWNNYRSSKRTYWTLKNHVENALFHMMLAAVMSAVF